ncbi:MAG: hypothetical protein R3F59_35620 [Myxococcota bacterium]
MSTPDVPESYKQAGLFMLISGVMNLMVGGVAVLMGLSTCVGTYGLCCFCPFIGVIPLGFGIHELMVASQMQQGRWIATAKGTNVAGLVIAVLTMSMINIVLEVLAMVQLGQPEAAKYLEEGAGSAMDWS